MAHPKTLTALIAALVAVSPTFSLAAPLASLNGHDLRTARFLQLDTDQAFTPGDETSLNPQPLPPNYRKRLIRLPGDEVMLSPQPLPPRIWLLTDPNDAN